MPGNGVGIEDWEGRATEDRPRTVDENMPWVAFQGAETHAVAAWDGDALALLPAVRTSPWWNVPAPQVLRRAGRTFAFATRLFPRDVRGEIAVLYSFCRLADDIADADLPVDERLYALDRLEEGFARAVETGRDLLPAVELFARYAIPLRYVHEMFEGFRSDLRHSQPATFADLRTYCYRVASTVGLMLSRIWRVDDAGALARAEALGVAMQLTNIVRDVGEDRNRGRIYLPLEWLDRYGVSPSVLQTPDAPAVLVPVLEHAMQTADHHYRSGLEGVPLLPTFARFPVGLAAVLYRDIHTSVRANGYDVFNRRAHTTLPRKLWLTLRAWRHRRQPAALVALPADTISFT